MSNIWLEVKSSKQVIEVTGFTIDKNMFGDKYSFTAYVDDTVFKIKDNITREEAEYEYELWKGWIADGKFHLVEIEGE